MSTHNEGRTVLAPPFQASMADIAYEFKGKPYKGIQSLRNHNFVFSVWSLQYPCNGGYRNTGCGSSHREALS